MTDATFDAPVDANDHYPLRRGVVLDADTLGDDIDLAPLTASLPDWSIHPDTSPETIVERTGDADVIVLNKVPMDAATIAALPRLKLIATLATGVNQIDLDACRAQGVAVANARDYATESVAQHVFAMLLAHLTQLRAYTQDVRSGRWSAHDRFCLLDHPIRELAGLVFGIVGYGVLGQRVAALAQAFGARVLVAESLRRDASDAETGRVPLDDLLTQADIVSLHLPLTPETVGLFGAERLARMKPGAVLINTARGGLIDSSALADGLRAGRPAVALLDVLDREPPPPDHPLLDPALAGRVMITPHTAWASRTARQNVVAEVCANIAAFRVGEARNRVV